MDETPILKDDFKDIRDKLMTWEEGKVLPNAILEEMFILVVVCEGSIASFLYDTNARTLIDEDIIALGT